MPTDPEGGSNKAAAGAAQWLETAFGWPVGAYGLLATIGAGMFLRPKILQAAALTFVVAVGVEVLEAMLNHGSCSARDLVPAAIGIAMAVGIHTAMRSATPRVVAVRKPKRARRSPPKRGWISL